MPVDPAAYRPTLADLGGIMRARTRNGSGDELGTFTEDTRPTAEEAEGLIDRALGLVSPRLGDVPESATNLAPSIVALRAAMFVETSYYPEETSGEGNAYASYREQYRDALADYDDAVGRNVGEAKTVVASVPVSTIVASVPPPS
jgi:hypothetical protein